MIDPAEWCWVNHILDELDPCEGRIDPAHVGFTEHWLSKAPTGPHLTKEQANDSRLIKPICRKHHHRLDNGRLDIRREDIPASVEHFAKEYNLVHKLNREYRLRKEADEVLSREPDAVPPGSGRASKTQAAE